MHSLSAADLILLSDTFCFLFPWALVAGCNLEMVRVRIRGFNLRISGQG